MTSSFSKNFTVGAKLQPSKATGFIGRKFGQKKSLEQKTIECSSNSQFIRVTKKDNTVTFEEKVRLTSKTFVSSPDLVVLFSARLVGTVEDIKLLSSSEDLSKELKILIDVDLSQKMDVSNYDKLMNVDVYSFFQNPDGSFSYNKTRTTTFKELFDSEIENNKIIRSDKKSEKDARMFCLDKLERALYLLRNNHAISRLPVPTKVKVQKEEAKQKENTLVVRVRDHKEKNLWLDVSHCKDNGSGVHGNIKSCPANAYTFPEIPELSSCFYVPTRDTNPKSPTRGLSNVGVINFLVYYFGASQTLQSKSRAECTSFFNESFGKQKTMMDLGKLTSEKSHNSGKVGLGDL